MKKPKLSFWQLWNMSFGFLGIQMGFALQTANTSRIFQTLHAEVENLAIYWLAGPVTGLLVQPLIGYFSDRTWMPKLGRRRPYFLLGAILASIALFFMPNSPVLWMAVGMLWIMDSSFNITMEPFRAFVGDMLPSEQRTQGFAMQSFFIGTGAVVASAMPWIFTNWFGIANTAPDGIIPPSVKYSFYLGGLVFLIAVLWTIISTKEYSPEEMEAFESSKEDDYQDDVAIDTKKSQLTNLLFLSVGVLAILGIYFFGLKRDLYVVAFMAALFGLLGIIAANLKKGGGDNAFTTIMEDFYRIPPTMKQLAVVQFFSWFALFAMWIYTTPAVTEYFYNTTDTTSQAYNDGADWVNILFAVYNGIAALVAFALPVLAKRTSRKVAHMIALFIGGVGMLSMYFLNTPNQLIFSMVCIGVAWASILSMPYAILTGSLPQKKLGYYMGVFNFFIVIPQMVAASILGWMLVSLFNNSSISALLIGGISLFIAGIVTLRVKDEY